MQGKYTKTCTKEHAMKSEDLSTTNDNPWIRNEFLQAKEKQVEMYEMVVLHIEILFKELRCNKIGR